ncbi:endoribonuclease L-PSP [Burkholderia vietnamiensis]|uniref:endoribonuclease L-PSP n=1 Tax=Burkholderia vietnamiensis TaxID=60552 RepID=UPI000D789B00|nr:endoribonuclease L-PSP [Burkholderia vietnamiensis]
MSVQPVGAERRVCSPSTVPAAAAAAAPYGVRAAIEDVRRDAAGLGVRTSFVHADACGGNPPVEIDASAAPPPEHRS